MEQERNDSPFAREFVKASGLLHLLRFGRFPNASDHEEAEAEAAGPGTEEDIGPPGNLHQT